MKTRYIATFIRAREDIRIRRADGQPKPWTADPILQNYRFCNVHRENDTVTKWISENWRGPHSEDPNLWFAMVVARLVNKPSTLAALGYPVPWNAKKFVRVIHKVMSTGSAFSPAYIVSTNGCAQDKAEYLAEHVLTPLWVYRKQLTPIEGDTLATFHARLMKCNGLGSFMAAQVVADMKYVPPLLYATDWDSWAASGPGSKRGLNRVCGRPVNAQWKESAWHNTLTELRVDLLVECGIKLHAQDVQNCLCEFDKYERVRLGKGRPKQRYDGGA